MDSKLLPESSIEYSDGQLKDIAQRLAQSADFKSFASVVNDLYRHADQSLDTATGVELERFNARRTVIKEILYAFDNALNWTPPTKEEQEEEEEDLIG